MAKRRERNPERREPSAFRSVDNRVFGRLRGLSSSLRRLSHLRELHSVDHEHGNADKNASASDNQATPFVASHAFFVGWWIIRSGGVGVGATGVIAGLYYVIYGDRLWLGMLLFIGGGVVFAYSFSQIIDRVTAPSDALRRAVSERGNGHGV